METVTELEELVKKEHLALITDMANKIKEQGHQINLLTDLVSSLAKEIDRHTEMIGKLTYCVGKIVGTEIPPEIAKYAQ